MKIRPPFRIEPHTKVGHILCIWAKMGSYYEYQSSLWLNWKTKLYEYVKAQEPPNGQAL